MIPDITRAPDSFQRLLAALARPSAFPPEGGAQPDDAIQIAQTHASAVLLTKTRAYKIKKPVNPGFLDYSTAKLRRRFCVEECVINQPLAPGVYLGIAPVLTFAGREPMFGQTVAPEHAPQLGERIQDGIVEDFAVAMRRLPEERTLAALIQSGQATGELLRRIARFIADFHQGAQRSNPRASIETVDTALANILLTLEQAKDDIGFTLSATTYNNLRRYINKFIDRRRSLLESRARGGHCLEGHGDLRMEHIYWLPREADSSGNELLIVDRIEFDPHYRIGDVASDIAFLAVELERARRADLAHEFIQEYIDRSGDEALLEVAPFYDVYRAIVRGHVRSILLADPNLEDATQASVRDEAAEMFAIAAFHATIPTEPHVVMIGGLIGTGKSTLAMSLRAETGWPIVSSDQTRKRLAGLPIIAPTSEPDQRRIYTADWDTRVYDQLVTDARALLADGHSVILDATLARRAWRAAAAQLARDMSARAVFLECVSPRELALSRLASRWRMKQRQKNSTAPELDERTRTSLASDGRPELYDQVAIRWEPFDASEERGIAHKTIDTSTPKAQILEQALAALNIPRLICKT
jgi:aminoglycoside phosphotransferase family enzyme/predicted kinase